MKLTFHNWIDTVVWRLLACRNPRPWNSHPARVREESLGLSSAIQEHRCQYYCCSVSKNIWSRRLDLYRGLKGKHESNFNGKHNTRWLDNRSRISTLFLQTQTKTQTIKQTNIFLYSAQHYLTFRQLFCFHFCREKAFSSRLFSTSRVIVGLKQRELFGYLPPRQTGWNHNQANFLVFPCTVSELVLDPCPDEVR